MRAVISISTTTPEAATWPIAGRPLICRQIQWLRTIGCTQIIVQIASGPVGDFIAKWLDEGEVQGRDLIAVLAPIGVGGRQLASRAGVPTSAPVLLLEGDVVGTADLVQLFVADVGGGVRGQMAPPDGLDDLATGEVALHRGGTFDRPLVGRTLCALDGWGARLASLSDAHRIGTACLEERLPTASSFAPFAIPVHAARRSPGVWIARGAHVDANATLVGPVLIGPGAIVEADAVVGPATEVGPGAVIGIEARIRHALVDADVIVGDGLFVEHARATRQGLVSLALAHDVVPLGDPLLLTARDRTNAATHEGGSGVARLASAVARALGAHGTSERLREVADGEAPWTGVRAEGGARPFFDVEPLLTDGLGGHVDATTQRRLRDWYRRAADAPTKRALVRRAIGQAMRAASRVEVTMRRGAILVSERN